MNIYYYFFLVFFAGYLFADNIPEKTKNDSTEMDSFQLNKPDLELLKYDNEEQIVKYNPWLAAALSCAVPGLGQVYCKKYFKGGLFLASEIIAGISLGGNKIQNLKTRRQKLDSLETEVNKSRDDWISSLDSLNNPGADASDSLIDFYSRQADEQKIGYELNKLDYAVNRYDRRERRYSVHQNIGWLAGIYVWNIFDGLNSSNVFKSNTHKKPGRAALLSAVPCLGLGQIYNGSVSKAGMILCVETNLIFMSINNHRLMQDALDQRAKMLNENSWQNKYSAENVGLWDQRYNEVKRKRNMYLWYSILFYLYGIFDAVVDAHLHDYSSKIRLTPTLNGSDNEIGLSLNVTFPVK